MQRKEYSSEEKLAISLLRELYGEENAGMPEEFKAHFMEDVIRRKQELEEMEEDDHFWEDFELAEDDMDPEESPEESQRQIPEIPVINLYREQQTGRKKLAIVLSLVAVLVFLFGGTLLTRGKLHNSPSTGTPGNVIVNQLDDINENDIVDTSEVKNPDAQNTFSGFMSDMWLFVRTASPYLGCMAAGALITFGVTKKKKV